MLGRRPLQNVQQIDRDGALSRNQRRKDGGERHDDDDAGPDTRAIVAEKSLTLFRVEHSVSCSLVLRPMDHEAQAAFPGAVVSTDDAARNTVPALPAPSA